MFYVIIGSYVAAEVGIASWIVEYLEEYRGLSISLSSWALSLFFGTIMLGRFVSSFIVEKVGYIKLMIYSITLAIVCLIIGTQGGLSTSFFVPISGLFLSTIFQLQQQQYLQGLDEMYPAA